MGRLSQTPTKSAKSALVVMTNSSNKQMENLLNDNSIVLNGGAKLSKMSVKKLRSRAKKLCVKRSGSKSQIAARIRSAKKSKKALKKRCSRKH
jgi:hypothetical protein